MSFLNEIDYSDYFGEYFKSDLEENHEITNKNEVPANLSGHPDYWHPNESELEIECWNKELYTLDIENYFKEYGSEGIPVKGRFTLQEFIDKDVECGFTFELVEIKEFKTVTYKIKYDDCGWC